MTDVISWPQFLLGLPKAFKGMPRRIQGLYMVGRQKPDQKTGLGHCLETAASRNPKGVAVIFEGRSIRYAEFDAWVNRIANYLYETGTRKGDVVAILMHNRPELLACVAATAKLGAVSALLNTSQKGHVLKHSVDLVDPTRVIVGEELLPVVLEVPESLPESRQNRLFLADSDTLNEDSSAPEGWFNLAEGASASADHSPASLKKVTAADPCCYFYTSGTTGLPKAAVMTHGRFMKAYAGMGIASLQLGASDRAYVTLPFYHGTALVIGWGSVLAGAAGLVMARQFSATRFWQDVRENDVTAICYVGELCRYLLAQPESGKDRDHKVRLMFGNGLRPNIWKAFKRRFGIREVMEFYGSSEGNVGFLNLFNFDCTVGFTTVPYAIVEYDLEADEPRRHADGFLRRVKKGEAGLLLGEITDTSPFDGYTDPEKTEKTILRNVFREGDAWFNTGDLLRDQGFKHAQFVDRLGDTFRWKGENVSTTEVENVMAGIPEILDAVVYGVEIPKTNGRAGMACVRLNEGEQFDPRNVWSRLSEALPAYAIPVFVRITQAMETTGTFKYKKTDLKRDAFDPDRVEDALWVCLPGEQAYRPLDEKIYRKIQDGSYRF